MALHSPQNNVQMTLTTYTQDAVVEKSLLNGSVGHTTGNYDAHYDTQEQDDQHVPG